MTSDDFWVFLTYLPTQKSEVICECSLRVTQSKMIPTWIIRYRISLNSILQNDFFDVSEWGNVEK